MTKVITILLFTVLMFIIVGCSKDIADINGTNADKNKNNKSSEMIFAVNTYEVILDDGSTYHISADEMQKNIAGHEYTMFAYNAQIPGPRLKVRQGSTIFINFTNNLNEETTIHWHGLRHNYLDDGVPNVSQPPVKPGESFEYTLSFPDEGIFWYHPHVREDRQQDLGLYGNILVVPQENKYSDYDKNLFLMLDDILIENGNIVPHGKENANYALMGRYGNLMIVNGEKKPKYEFQTGELVRLYFTVVSNVRPFNISIPGVQLKLVGGDIGRYEKENVIDSLIMGPAERYIVEIVFDSPGEYNLITNTPWGKNLLATFDVISGIKSDEGPILSNQDVIKDIDKYRPYFDSEADEIILLGIVMGDDVEEMHGIDNIEWEDTMGEHNSEVQSDHITWYMEDSASGKRNMNFTYRFDEGDIKILKFVNSNESKHPMQHMIHLHGQRFLVIEENGERKKNLVWKDTFLIPSGTNTTILLDASNPGIWMFHCHIAEHLEAGMMSMFEVGNESDNGMEMH